MQLTTLRTEEILAASWRAFRKRFRFLIFLSSLATLFFLAAAGALGYWVYVWYFDNVTALWNWTVLAITQGQTAQELPPLPGHDLLVGGVALLATALLLLGTWLWINASLWFGVMDQNSTSIKQALLRGAHAAPRLLFTTAIKALVIFGGALLFGIPGILFAGWFLFAELCALKGDKPLSALKTSAGLVVDRWWHMVAPMLAAYFIIIAPLTLTFLIQRRGLALLFSIAYIIVAMPWYHTYKYFLFEHAKRTVYRANAQPDLRVIA